MSLTIRQPDSIVAALRGWANSYAEKTALILSPSEAKAQHRSYKDIDLDACRIAAALQAQGLSGKRVLLQAEGSDFIVSLLGCFYAGAIAVPAHEPISHPKQAARLQAMLRAADLSGVISNDAALLNNRDAELARLQPLSIDSLLQADANDWRERSPTRNDIAFIQFTSGSTADPKGVIVDHGNLVANFTFMQRVMNSGRE